MYRFPARGATSDVRMISAILGAYATAIDIEEMMRFLQTDDWTGFEVSVFWSFCDVSLRIACAARSSLLLLSP
jgi:hypothetical protein